MHIVTLRNEGQLCASACLIPEKIFILQNMVEHVAICELLCELLDVPTLLSEQSSSDVSMCMFWQFYINICDFIIWHARTCSIEF